MMIYNLIEETDDNPEDLVDLKEKGIRNIDTNSLLEELLLYSF
jgi:hypothetical protein